MALSDVEEKILDDLYKDLSYLRGRLFLYEKDKREKDDPEYQEYMEHLEKMQDLRMKIHDRMATDDQAMELAKKLNEMAKNSPKMPITFSRKF